MHFYIFDISCMYLFILIWEFTVALNALLLVAPQTCRLQPRGKDPLAVRQCLWGVCLRMPASSSSWRCSNSVAPSAPSAWARRTSVTSALMRSRRSIRLCSCPVCVCEDLFFLIYTLFLSGFAFCLFVNFAVACWSTFLSLTNLNVSCHFTFSQKSVLGWRILL